MEQVRAGVVAHRVRRAARHRPRPSPCRRRRPARAACPRWTISPAVCVPATRCVSSTSNTTSPSAPPTAARRGRRSGRRPRRRTACGRARARRRRPPRRAAPPRPSPRAPGTRCRRAGSRRFAPPCSSSRSRGTSVSPARAWIDWYSAPIARPGGPCRPSCRSGCARAARRAPRRTRRGRRATPYSAASSTVRSIGKPNVSWSLNATSPGRTGASAGRSSALRADLALGRGQRDERLLEQRRAGLERPPERRPPRG